MLHGQVECRVYQVVLDHMHHLTHDHERSESIQPETLTISHSGIVHWCFDSLRYQCDHDGSAIGSRNSLIKARSWHGDLIDRRQVPDLEVTWMHHTCPDGILYIVTGMDCVCRCSA